MKPDDKITYRISYKNYKNEPADIVIKDKLDTNVAFVSASDEGKAENGTVTWTLKAVEAGKEGTVTLTVKVLETALASMNGPGKVINNGDTASVKVGDDPEVTLQTAENPVDSKPIPEKKEIKPYEGTGILGEVKPGDKITYEISYRNYKLEAADIRITDKLDEHVDFVSASDGGKMEDGVVTWTFKDLGAGEEGTVQLTVKVLETALESKDGPGKVVNGGKNASVKVADDPEVTLNIVENPVTEIPVPEKKETEPYKGTGVLGAVKPGDEITYEISYRNYKAEAADVVITDKLDANVSFVTASDEGKPEGGVVTWTFKALEAGKEGTVTLTVKVLDSALESRNGPGRVINGGKDASVKVGDDPETTLNIVENPVPEDPEKKEIHPYAGNGVLGPVNTGDEITYEITYRNYKDEAADILITDKLDTHVAFVKASDEGKAADGAVTWTLKDVAAGREGTVTLTVKVLDSALASNGGPGKVVNEGKTASVKVGNDPAVTLDTVENPVTEIPAPVKKETEPYTGTGELGPVNAGDEITYEISYKNYKKQAADVVITDKLDTNAAFVSASDGGKAAEGTVTWTLKDIAAGKEGTVTLTVKVLETALASKDGPGKVVNGGNTATVRVGNDPAVTLNTVENPVTEIPVPMKRETVPYTGTGVLGAVNPDEEITYEISYRNYKATAADIVITDKMDAHVAFVKASDEGKAADGVVAWTLKNVAAGKEGTVTLTVKVLESALVSNGGPGKVVNGGETASVKVGNDPAVTLNSVENPVPRDPEKKETVPYEGNGVLGPVAPGEEITYEISYINYKDTAADITIKDKLDAHVAFASASDGGVAAEGIVTWTLKNVESGKSGTVTLTVKVLESALEQKGGPGKVVNGGETASVKVGDDPEVTLDTVENPVKEAPVPGKKETAPYAGTGILGTVNPGDEVTYEISYKNYKATTADIVITDKLDAHVAFVKASNQGKAADGTVTWTLKDAAPGQEGTVTLTVKVLESALVSNGGPGKVVNGGDTASVKVGNDPAVTLNTVENPVTEIPVPMKKETEPYTGTGKLGAVNAGDEITYEISYENYKANAADIIITDKLDDHVVFVSASDGGKAAEGTVTWTLKDVAAGKAGTVMLTVKVLETALESKDGPGKVVNGGETASVKVGSDPAVTLNTVENPVTEIPVPVKKETAPYTGTGVLGAVNPDDEITYEISYRNYKAAAADIVITDTLDKHAAFVSASNGGEAAGGVVTWTLKNIAAGQEGTVTLTVKVLKDALEALGGPGKVVNGGDTASVKVGNDPAVTLNKVENPVPRDPEKKEIVPYEGNGVLGAVVPGEEITYEISYINYKAAAADITIEDKLDAHAAFVSASDEGKAADGTVTWTLKNVPAGQAGTVTLTVKVLKEALASLGGPGKVVNGGETASVKVGDDPAVTLDSVENPVADIPVPAKREIVPYVGNGVLGTVKPGDLITYEISYTNYKAKAADVVIRDRLDPNVQVVSATRGATLTNRTVTWTLKDVPAGTNGRVTLTVRVLETALRSKNGPGKVVNNGDTASVKIGDDPEYTLDTVENPVPEQPAKKETAPYEGNGKLGPVAPGDEITYEISYTNYKPEAADILIRDQLDVNAAFVSASDEGKAENGVVIWTLKNVEPGKNGTVKLTVKVLESALASMDGPGKVVNGGDTASVKVGNDPESTLDTVENPVSEKPQKTETAPYSGTGLLGPVKAGDQITYEISYRNYKSDAADIVISDKLDKNVSFVSASDSGTAANGTVTWTLKNVAAGQAGKVSLTVRVLESALETKGGPGKVVNGGDTASVKVGNDPAYTLNTVENPVPEPPHKREIAPGFGTGMQKQVTVDEEITYEISYKNYKNTAATVTITDQLDKNVKFVLADNNGKFAGGTVTWTIADVPAGKEGRVTVKVKVLSGARSAGKVTNRAKVKIGNDPAFDTEEVVNPVKNTNTPKTGDDSNSLLWTILLILSLLAAGWFGFRMIRANKARKP